MLSDPTATIVQSGYVAHPIGKKIFEIGEGEVLDYFGQLLEVRATRKVLTGASAHADRNGLARLVERCLKVNPNLKVILTHGEPEAKLALKVFLASIMKPENIYIQGENQHFEINKHTLASGNILVDDDLYVA
jgi:Cft2 family RNA processing exonuclease